MRGCMSFAAAAFVAASCVAAETSAELRGFGTCVVSREVRQAGGEDVSVAVFAAQSSERARMIGGKFLYELGQSHGVETRGTAGRPWFATPGGQGFAVSVVGATCRIASGSAAAIGRIAGDTEFAPDGSLVESAPFPEYMKRFGWGTYGMGGFDNITALMFMM